LRVRNVRRILQLKRVARSESPHPPLPEPDSNPPLAAVGHGCRLERLTTARQEQENRRRSPDPAFQKHVHGSLRSIHPDTNR
jgi:hypothetical protein